MTNATNARDAYQAHANDIARLMDVLEMELDEHAQGVAADPGNWGKAGTLAKVRGDLIDLVGFMSGMEPPQIEEFLADAGPTE